MIAIWHADINELEFVASLDGVGPDAVVVADPAPDDWETVPYAVVDGELVANLDRLRQRKRVEVQTARDRAMLDNVAIPDLPDVGDVAEFQLRSSTPEGKGGYDYIMGFFTRAQDAVRWEEAYTRTFKLADNRLVAFTAAQWVLIGDTIEAVMQGRFARGEMILALLELADTPEAIAAISWDMELPE